MNVLVTGSGLVGSYATKELVSRGARVTLLDLNPDYNYIQAIAGNNCNVVQGAVHDLSFLCELFRVNNFEAVVHSAGLMKIRIEQDPWEGFKANILGAASVAEAARQAAISQFVYISSLSVYDLTLGGDIVEDGPKSPESLYDHTKFLSENWLKVFWKGSSSALTVVRPSGIYGVGTFRGGAWMGKQLQDLLSTAIEGNTEKIVIRESDFGTNEYLYVKDLAVAISQVLEHHHQAGDALTLNIGSGHLVRAEELSQALSRLFPKIKFIYQEGRAKHKYLERTSSLSIKTAQSQINYTPKYGDINLGLLDYLQEFVQYRKSCNHLNACAIEI